MEGNLNKGASGKLFDFARSNRKMPTMAEQLLWQELRGRKFLGYKFRRQHPLSTFIADFYCHEGKLIVELDGEIHDEREQRNYDKGRTFELKELALKVIRFRNEEVVENVEQVLKEIGKNLIPGPSLQGERS